MFFSCVESKDANGLNGAGIVTIDDRIDLSLLWVVPSTPTLVPSSWSRVMLKLKLDLMTLQNQIMMKGMKGKNVFILLHSL